MRFVAVLLLSTPLAFAQTARIDLSDFGRLTDLADPRISPDGERIVLVVSRPDYEENRFENELLRVDVATREVRPLTHARPSVRRPRWSPSGDRIAFLDSQDKDTKPQIHILPMGGGEAKVLTDAPGGVSLFAWRPDGNAIAYVSEEVPEEVEGEERHNKSFEVGHHVYLATSASQPSHLWLISLDGGEPERLSSDTESVSTQFGGGLDWSPDGSSIAFVTQPTPHSGELARTLKVLELASRSERSLIHGTAMAGSPQFSPDGQQIAYSAPTGPEPAFNPRAVFLMPSAGGESRNATPDIDRDVGGRWLPDGSLLAMGPDRTRVGAWVQPMDGSPRRLDLGNVVPGFLAHVGANGSAAFTGTEPDRPEELYYKASVGAAPIRLTELNEEVAAKELGSVASIEWDGPDGFRENGVLTFPPHFDRSRKYPLVLHIHGGPMGTSTEGFSIFRQLLAAQDWIVFSPNYRGSNNQGRAFQSAVINDAGEGPGRDVMAGIEAVKAKGFIDDDRIAVSGWSYGGYMTTWLIAHYQGWRVAVAGAAVTDWFDWYNLADLNTWSGYGLGGSPWLNDNQENYWDQSPIKYAPNIRTPTLILSNTGDPRVTVTQSYKLYYALEDNGVPVKFVAYPIPGHFPGDPVHQRDVYRRWTEWIAEHFEVAETSQN